MKSLAREVAETVVLAALLFLVVRTVVQTYRVEQQVVISNRQAVTEGSLDLHDQSGVADEMMDLQVRGNRRVCGIPIPQGAIDHTIETGTRNGKVDGTARVAGRRPAQHVICAGLPLGRGVRVAGTASGDQADGQASQARSDAPHMTSADDSTAPGDPGY